MDVQTRGRGTAWRAGALALLALLLSVSCNMGVPNYSLTVTQGLGVTGTPPTGQYSYKELTQVYFNFSGANTLDTVEAFLNDTIRYAGQGAFIIYRDGYTLKANIIDVRGAYKIAMSYTDGSVTPPDPFIITLVGADRFSGAFTDDRGYHGTWTAQSDVLQLAYWDWDFYVLTSSVYDFGHSAGAFAGGGYTGTFAALKQ
jgi:hypothetical protein